MYNPFNPTLLQSDNKSFFFLSNKLFTKLIKKYSKILLYILWFNVIFQKK